MIWPSKLTSRYPVKLKRNDRNDDKLSTAEERSIHNDVKLCYKAKIVVPKVLLSYPEEEMSGSPRRRYNINGRSEGNMWNDE